MARNATGGGGGGGGTKAIPDGQPNCLAGLTFVFTGELPSFSREEAQDAAKRFGGWVYQNRTCFTACSCIHRYRRVTGAPSAKTSYVVVGENAGPKKLQTIKEKGLKMLDEDGFLNLIATKKGVMDEATIAKMEKEEEKIRQNAKEMEMREKAAAKEAQKGGLAAAKYVQSTLCPTYASLTTSHEGPWILALSSGLKSTRRKVLRRFVGTKARLRS